MFLERDYYMINIIFLRSFSLFGKKLWTTKKKIALRYRQANVKQVMSFMEENNKKDFSLQKRVEDFVEEYGTPLTTADKKHLKEQVLSIRVTIQQTYFKGCFASKSDKKTDDYQSSSQKMDAAPMQANIAFLAKETSTSIIDLYEKCTISDIDYLCEGVIRNINSTTEKGRKKNKLVAIANKAKNRTAEEMERIKARLDRIPDDGKIG